MYRSAQHMGSLDTNSPHHEKKHGFFHCERKVGSVMYPRILGSPEVAPGTRLLKKAHITLLANLGLQTLSTNGLIGSIIPHSIGSNSALTKQTTDCCNTSSQNPAPEVPAAREASQPPPQANCLCAPAHNFSRARDWSSEPQSLYIILRGKGCPRQC